MNPDHPNYKAIKNWSLEAGVKVPAIKKPKERALSMANKQKGKGNRYKKVARKDDLMGLLWLNVKVAASFPFLSEKTGWIRRSSKLNKVNVTINTLHLFFVSILYLASVSRVRLSPP